MMSMIKNAAILSGCLLSLQVQAQIYEASFTDTNGASIHSPATSLLLNPVTPITLTVISGLDRFVNIKVTNATGSEMLNTLTTRTGVSDRLKAADGSEFYGKVVALPALGEGQYTVQVNILDLQKNIVATYSYNWMLDSTPPTGSALTANASSGTAVPGTVFKLGLEATGQYDFTSSNVTDANGIDKGVFNIYRADGSLYSSTAMQYDITGKKMYFTYAKNGSKGATMPTSNLDEDFEARTIIYDKAGNRLTLPLQKFRFDNTVGEITLFAVHDPNNSASVVPGKTNYPAYTPGMTVNENPIRLIYKVPKSNYRTYAEGGLLFYNGYTPSVEVATDSTYSYVEMTLPFQAFNSDMARMANFGQWGGYNPSYTLTLNPLANKTPVFTGKWVEYRDSNGNWIHWKDLESVTSDRLPIVIDRVRFNIEARPFNQEILGRASCSVPAGSTSCEAAESLNMATGTMGFLRPLYIVRSVSQPILRSEQFIMTRWNNQQKPVIGKVTYNEKDNELTALASLEGDGNWFDSVSMREFFLINKSTGARMTPTGTITSRFAGNYTVLYKLASQAEGRYDVEVNIRDFFQNLTAKTYGTIVIDRTPPQVAISFDGKPILDDTVVYGLENLRVTLSDSLTTPRITRLQLTGGPTSDNVELTWSPAGVNTYMPEYPKLFPNLETGNKYTLHVTTSDSQSNSKTYTQSFTYVPNNLVQLHNLKTLSVKAPLKTSDNVPLAYLQTNVLRKLNGEIAQGVQDGTLTVRKDASFGITFNGVTASPGQTVPISIDMANGNEVMLPIYPSESSITGDSQFIIEISELH